jgi:hypothetical protein
MAHNIPESIPFRTLGPLSIAKKSAIGILVLLGIVAAFLAMGEPERFWQSLLFNWLFWSSVAMGMVMFAVALHLTNAGWAWSIRRFALAGVAFLPISFVLLIVVFFGYETYFHHWLHAEGDPVIAAKSAWLNLPSLVTRDLVGVLVLYGLAVAFAYFSVRPDLFGARKGATALYSRLTRGFRGVAEETARSHSAMNYLGVVLGLAYALLWGMVAIDLAMSMAPHWFSTMFPVAFFWTGFHGGVAATAIAVALLRPRLHLHEFITVRQFHDLGKLVFAFSVFWMYLNWSQYIVIWYGLLPWEQEFFVTRFSEPYAGISRAVVLLVFLIPFFGLLTRPPKTVPAILAVFSGIILLGHWLERFLITVPSIWGGEGLPLGLGEIGMGLGFLGLFLLAYTWFLQRFPVLPSPASLRAAGSQFITVPSPSGQTAAVD